MRTKGFNYIVQQNSTNNLKFITEITEVNERRFESSLEKENGLKLMSQRYIFATNSEKHQSSSPMRTPSIITSRAAFMLSTTDIKK